MTAHTIWLEKMAEFYGIDMTEARRRYQVITAHHGDPADPICVGCASRPHELSEYVECAAADGVDPSVYVRQEEGTYNPDNGHFLCTPCYIANGQPTGTHGWRAP